MRSFFRNVGATLWASLRIVGLGRRSFQLPDPGWGGALFLGVVAFGAALATSWAAVWTGSVQFYPMGVLWWSIGVASALLAVMLLCRIGRHQRMSAAAGLVFGSTIWLELLFMLFAWPLAGLDDPSSPSFSVLVIGWALLAVVVVLNVVVAWRLGRFSFQRFPVMGGLLMLVSTLATILFVPFQPMLAKAGEPEVTLSLYTMARQYGAAFADAFPGQGSDAQSEALVRTNTLDLERTLFQQFDKVQRAAAAIQRAPSDAPAYFFVGAAGYGSQGVFRREVTSAREIVDARLSTRGRSLLLVNDRHDMETHPLATVATLDAALSEVGRKMRPDRDVLLLYLTSHGAHGMFSIVAPGLATGNLTPVELRSMLDRSGIRNRVVIVSACYSGSFIEALEDPNTLIMTAARSDRSSFGCADQNEWTYFGDAFFNHALRDTDDLFEAFARAKAIIATWEQQKGNLQSEPQIVVGEAIRSTLAAMKP